MLRNEKYSPGPGAVLGPMLADLDAPGELTKELGVHNRADVLTRYHSQLYPLELIQKLALPRDPERSAALDLEEVHDALSDLKGRRAFFDPEADALLDASVKGDASTGYYISILYQVPSGRTARAVIPYDLCPESARSYEEQQEAEVAFATLERGLSSRRPSRAASADSADQAQADELRQLERRVRESEEAQAAVLEELQRLRDPEPWTGYDEAGADVVKERVTDGGVTEFGTAGLERIADYEERHKNRKTVLDAVEAAQASAGGE